MNPDEKNIFDLLPKDSLSKMSPENQDKIISTAVRESTDESKRQSLFIYTAIIFSFLYFLVLFLIIQGKMSLDTNKLSPDSKFIFQYYFMRSILMFIILDIVASIGLKLIITQKGFVNWSPNSHSKPEKSFVSGGVAVGIGLIIFVLSIIIYGIYIHILLY